MAPTDARIAAPTLAFDSPQGDGKASGYLNWLATQWPELAGGVPFYGTAPDLADVPRIRAPLLLHCAGNDQRVNATWPPCDAALTAAHVPHQAFV